MPACTGKASRRRYRRSAWRASLSRWTRAIASTKRCAICASLPAQNLANDPPFSQMNLVACRNLLIYIQPVLQKKIIPILHYALKPSGFLVLGSSESVSAFPDLFSTVDKKHKIYAKKADCVPAALRLCPVLLSRLSRGQQAWTFRKGPKHQAPEPEI